MRTFQYILMSGFTLLIFTTLTFAQKKQKIEIEHADSLEFYEIKGKKIRVLSGDVRIRQGNLLMESDKALFYNNNDVDAFGNVHINQRDSVDIYADSLHYNAKERYADIWSNVRLTNGQMQMKTKSLRYYLDEEKAVYRQSATIYNDTTTLSSKIGYMFTKSNMLLFKEDVVLTGPQYKLYADTLRYNVNTDVAYFYGPTNIETEESTIYTEDGWYNTRSNIALFIQNARISTPPNILNADTIYYEQQTGFGRAKDNIAWADTAENFFVQSQFLEFYQKQEKMVATDSAILIHIIEKDSLFLGADTLRSLKDTLDNRTFFAYNDVRIYKSDLQGIADSLVYSFRDSSFTLYNDPVIWSDTSQMVADTIVFLLKNNQINRINMLQNSFMINKSDTLLYNQIKGKKIFGFLKEGSINKMQVIGNAENVYYAKDDKNAYMGVNKALCSEMWIYFTEGKVDHINFIENPEGIFHPIHTIDPTEFLLEEFIWLEEERPLSKQDLYREIPDNTKKVKVPY